MWPAETTCLNTFHFLSFKFNVADIKIVITVCTRFDYSNSGSSFVRGQEISLTSGLQAAFNPIIQARFLRVVIVETNDVTENTKPIAING